MVVLPLAFTLLTAMPPSPPIAPRPVLREAIAAAARQSAVSLQRSPQYRRGRPYPLSPKTGRRVAFVIIGAAAGFMASAVIPIVASNGECPGSLPLVIGGTIGGGVLGALLAGR